MLRYLDFAAYVAHVRRRFLEVLEADTRDCQETLLKTEKRSLVGERGHDAAEVLREKRPKQRAGGAKSKTLEPTNLGAPCYHRVRSANQAGAIGVCSSGGPQAAVTTRVGILVCVTRA